MIRSISIAWRLLLIFSLLLPNVRASSVSAKAISPSNRPYPKQVVQSEQPPHPRPTIVRPQPRIGNRPDANENNSSKARSSNVIGKSAAKPLPLTFIENKGQFSSKELFRLNNG